MNGAAGGWLAEEDRLAETTRHPVQAWIMSNPCFYLFAVLLLLLVLLPLFEDSDVGKLWFMVMNLLPLLSPWLQLYPRLRGALHTDSRLRGRLFMHHFPGSLGPYTILGQCPERHRPAGERVGHHRCAAPA